jgi:hypothetical protein
MGATRSTNQWVAGALSSGFKWEDRESDHKHHPLLKLKMNGSTDSFIYLFILLMACTGTTLPFLLCSVVSFYKSYDSFRCNRTPLIWAVVIRIGSVLQVLLSRILQNKLALKLPVIGSGIVQ